MYEIKVFSICSAQNNRCVDFDSDLELPAAKESIHVMIQQMEGTAGQISYKALRYECRMDCLNRVMPEPCRLDELNYLAQRLSDLSEYELMKFAGAAVLSNSSEPKEFINLSYNLDCYEVIPNATDDEQLGIYCVENYKFESLRKVPLDMLNYLHHEKLGCLQRERDNGVYTEGNYIRALDMSHNQVYDGSHIPEQIKDTGYYIKLRLTSEKEPDGTWLKLPAGEDEVQVALNKLKVTVICECTVGKCVSILPKLEESIHQHPNLSDFIEKVNNLGFGIDQMPNREMTTKFKAALIYEDCTDLNFAADITENLNCYDFYPTLVSAEDYGRNLAFEKGYLKPSDNEISSCFDFEKYGREQMATKGSVKTEYGMISRNEKEFLFGYYTPPSTQQKMM